MMRRVFAGLAVVGLLLLATNNTAPVAAQLVRPTLAAFFVIMLFIQTLSLIHISEPTRLSLVSRMPSSA